MAPKVEIGMMILMGVGLVFMFVNRWQLKRGLVGLRATQFTAVMFALPITVILSLEGKLGSDAVATILGAILGLCALPNFERTG